MKTISLLGSTGSIGRNVLAVIRQFPNRFRIAGLAAGSNIKELKRQVEEFAPGCISVATAELAGQLREELPQNFRGSVFFGEEGNCKVATLKEADIVVSGVVGAVGLLPTLDAIEAGKDIGLANKETLVMAGALVMEAVRRKGVRLLPI